MGGFLETVRSSLGATAGRFRRKLLARVFLVVFSLLVLAGVAGAIAEKEIRSVAQDVAVNVSAAAISIGIAYAVFWLRFRASATRRIIDQVLEQPPSRARSVLERPRLADWLATSLRQRAVRGAIVVGEAGSGRATLLRMVARELATHGHLPIVLDGSELNEDESLVQAAKNRLSLMLADEDENAQDTDRLWGVLLRRRRLCVLVYDIDSYFVATTPSRRKREIQQLLDEVHRRCIPFVVALPQRLTTRMPEVAILRLPLLLPEQLAAYVEQRLEAIDPSWQPDADQLAHLSQHLRRTSSAYLLDLSVRYALAAGDGNEQQTITLLAESYEEPRPLRRELTWLCAVAGVATGPFGGDDGGPRTSCLARLGRKMLLTSADSYPWDRLLEGLNDAEQEIMLLGRAALEHRGVIEIQARESAEVVLFRNPAWLSLAGGLGIALDESGIWRALLGTDPSEPALRALSIAVARTMTERANRPPSFDALLRIAGVAEVAGHQLSVIAAVVDGLLASRHAERSDECADALLAGAWKRADDDEKLQFLATCDLARQPRVAHALWSQLKSPQVTSNTYRVRRAITRKIADAGDHAWMELGRTWAELCDRGFAEDLSAQTRERPHSEVHRSALAHLGWILPALLECADAHRDDVLELTQKLARAFMPPYTGYGPGPAAPPDIGLEISLFEGFKIAAAQHWSSQTASSDELCTLIVNRTRTARSWLSKLVAIHAATLLEGSDRCGMFRPFIEGFTSPHQHPFVRQAAAVSLAAIHPGSNVRETVFQSIWLDDAETLVSGGAELVDSSHGLLAMTTLVINLVEERGWTWDSLESTARTIGVDIIGQRIRDQVFSGGELPRCIQRGGGTWGAPHACSCAFQLCSAELTARRGTRAVGSAFLQRAKTTAGLSADYASTNPFRRVSFRVRARSMFDRLEKVTAQAENEGRAQARQEHIW
ncbi:MAG: hypothetical protein LC798_18160 [Chloroflexi bacterium]|nr:hypothetical protein [Chloroflexota bacterium]